MCCRFGTRPEAIKLAPVIYELQRQPEFELRICVSGQHRQMLDQVLNLFSIVPDYDLNLMRENQGLLAMTAGILKGLEGILAAEKPDIIMTQGDTTTAFAAALAAFYTRTAVAHVEAGLRTGRKDNPFPEEMNRILADALSTWCFAPTEKAHNNLLREGIPLERIHVTGNTVIDALRMIRDRQAGAENQSRLEAEFRRQYGIELHEGQRLLLVTGHRRESFGPEFENLCVGLRMVLETNPDVRIIYPVHLNPNVQRPVREILGGLDRAHLISPVDYSTMVWLLTRCYMVLTDSGGIQEEAPAFGKPVLVLRKTTERTESIAVGVARLVGTSSQNIFKEANALLRDQSAYRAMARVVNLYGDGAASVRISEVLKSSSGMQLATPRWIPGSAYAGVPIFTGSNRND